jgi:hypothetical protein
MKMLFIAEIQSAEKNVGNEEDRHYSTGDWDWSHYCYRKRLELVKQVQQKYIQ